MCAVGINTGKMIKPKKDKNVHNIMHFQQKAEHY